MSSANRQRAVAFFVGKNWTLEQSAGIVANLEAESGLRPDAVGDGGQAYGIAQWHPPRQAGFEALLGKPIRGSSFEDQLYWVHAELQGTERAAGTALAACTTAAEAGACVSRRYERPADREGEAEKRAALAERILQSYDPAAPLELGAAISPPPIPTPPEARKPPQTPDLTPSRSPEPAMPILPLLMTLLPQILNGFSPAGQAQAKPILGQPIEQLAPLLLNLFSMIGNKVGAVPEGQPLTTDAQAIATVAEFNRLKETNAALVTEIEQGTLNRLKIIAPMVDKLMEADRERNAAIIAGRESARLAQQSDTTGSVPILVKHATRQSSAIIGGLLITTVAAIIAKGYWPAMPDYINALIALLGMAVGSSLNEIKAMVAYFFDGTPSSNAAEAINAEINATRPKA